VIVNQKTFCNQWSMRSHIYFCSRISCFITTESMNSCSLEIFSSNLQPFNSSTKVVFVWACSRINSVMHNVIILYIMVLFGRLRKLLIISFGKRYYYYYYYVLFL
jgi:hypothetical protein